MRAPLFEEERDVRGSAPVSKRLSPFQGHWPGLSAALPANYHPVDLRSLFVVKTIWAVVRDGLDSAQRIAGPVRMKIKGMQSDVAQQRLARQKADLGRDRQQYRDAAVRVHLILYRCSKPHVGVAGAPIAREHLCDVLRSFGEQQPVDLGRGADQIEQI